MTEAQHPGIRRVLDALRAAGLDGPASRVRVLTDEVRTAAGAADALGVPVGAIANSLIFRADEEPLLVMTSGAHRAEQGLLAEVSGARRVRRADPEFVRAHTGQVIGGVAPIGHPTRIRTIVDHALAAFDVVWAAAGHPRSVFPLTYPELVALTQGTPAHIAAEAMATQEDRSGSAGVPGVAG